jgi:hypothetical protein
MARQVTNLYSELQRRRDVISNNHNRIPQVTDTHFFASGVYGVPYKAETDKAGSNNFLTHAWVREDKRSTTSSQARPGSANKLSERFYARKMSSIANPPREEHLEMVNRLNEHRKPVSVVGFVPNPKSESGHCITEPASIVSYYSFYDF